MISFIYSKCLPDIHAVDQGRRQVKNVGWTHIASAEREPITGLWSGTPRGHVPLNLIWETAGHGGTEGAQKWTETKVNQVLVSHIMNLKAISREFISA